MDHFSSSFSSNFHHPFPHLCPDDFISYFPEQTEALRRDFCSFGRIHQHLCPFAVLSLRSPWSNSRFFPSAYLDIICLLSPEFIPPHPCSPGSFLSVYVQHTPYSKKKSSLTLHFPLVIVPVSVSFNSKKVASLCSFSPTRLSWMLFTYTFIPSNQQNLFLSGSPQPLFGQTQWLIISHWDMQCDSQDS